MVTATAFSSGLFYNFWPGVLHIFEVVRVMLFDVGAIQLLTLGLASFVSLGLFKLYRRG